MGSHNANWVIVPLVSALLPLTACQVSIQINPANATPTGTLTTTLTTEPSTTQLTTPAAQNTSPIEQPPPPPPPPGGGPPVVVVVTATSRPGPTSTPVPTNPPIPTCPQPPPPTSFPFPFPRGTPNRTPTIPPTPSNGCLLIRNQSAFTITYTISNPCAGLVHIMGQGSILSHEEKLFGFKPGCYGVAAGQTFRGDVNIIAGEVKVIDVQQ